MTPARSVSGPIRAGHADPDRRAAHDEWDRHAGFVTVARVGKRAAGRQLSDAGTRARNRCSVAP